MVIDKPLRMTSMDVVDFVRMRAGGAKTGHAGTLDPLASGVLVMAIGKATKVIDQIMATDKRYETAIDLSAFTTTDDLAGERTEVDVPNPPLLADVQRVIEQFVGSIMQQPPAFSAKKIGGKRAYAMARKGQDVQLPPQPVLVHSLELIDYRWPLLTLRIHCGKGFYVRSLARDVGRALGTGGHCTAIRRTAVGPFALELARPLEELPSSISQGDLLSIAEALEMTRRDDVAMHKRAEFKR